MSTILLIDMLFKKKRNRNRIMILSVLCVGTTIFGMSSEAYAAVRENIPLSATIKVHTPVGIGSDSGIYLSTLGGEMLRAGSDLRHQGVITYFTVCPDNTVSHLPIAGFGYRDYLVSLSGQPLLKNIMDRSGRMMEANVACFPFDVYADRTGNGLSGDDFYFPKGTQIPVGIKRTFYVLSSEASVSGSARVASIAVNAMTTDIFENDGAISAEASAQRSANKDAKNTSAYTDIPVVLKPSIVSASITGTSCDYVPINQQLTLKRGYSVTLRVDTCGEYFSEAAYVTVTPEFTWVDDNKENEKEIILFFEDFVDGKHEYLIMPGSERDVLKDYSGEDEKLCLDSAAKKLKKSVDVTYDETKKIGEVSVGLIRAEECFYKGLNLSDLPASSLSSDKLKELLQKTNQEWYIPFYIPTNAKAVLRNSAFGLMTEKEQYDELVYGFRDFLSEGFIKCTFKISAYDDFGRRTDLVQNGNEIVIYYDVTKNIGDDYDVHVR